MQQLRALQPLAAFQACHPRDGRAAYLACKGQPSLHLLQDALAKAGPDPAMHPDIKAILAQSCNAYAAQEARWSWLPFALLARAGWQDLDGQPSGSKEERHLAWYVWVRSVLDALPSNTLLTMVDCRM